MLPDSMTAADKEAFESVLSAMTMLEEQATIHQALEPTAPPVEREVTPEEEREKEEEESTSAKISKGIAIGK